MFHKLAILACYLAVTIAQYHQPQYQQAQYQQAQYQQQPQYQQAQYQQPEPVPTAAQFPAGVDAQLCPNYPDCSNPLLAVQAVARAHDPRYQAQNEAAQPKNQYPPDVQQRLDRGEYIGDGDYQGEGLDEALAPEVAVRAQYAGQSAAAQYATQPTAGAVQYPAQQAASQYAARPTAVQYPAQLAASQYSAQPGAVQYPAQHAASQYSAQPGAVQYPAQRAASQYAVQPAGIQYPAQNKASQLISGTNYISAPQSASARQYYQPRPAVRGSPYAQATLFSPQYVQPAPVSEGHSYSPLANVVASGSEPVPSVELPAGVDASACPNYPFCHS